MEQARQILLHPNFNKLSLDQIQKVFASIIASGVSKPQIESILREKERYNSLKQNVSNLELLPRNVFKTLVEIGQIQGRDLVYLCNSSPILRNYCLANSTDINGEVIETEEIYRIALNKVLRSTKYKITGSPSKVYQQLTQSYKVKILNSDDNFKESSTIFSRRLRISPDMIVNLQYDKTLRITSKLTDESIVVLENVEDILVKDSEILLLDSNGDIWYTVFFYDNMIGKHLITTPMKIVKTDGLVSINLKIKSLISSREDFGFLTEDGRVFRINFTPTGSGLRYNMYEELRDIKYAYENYKRITAITLNNEILYHIMPHQPYERLPFSTNLIKVRLMDGEILALDDKGDLFKVEKGVITLFESKVKDFEITHSYVYILNEKLGLYRQDYVDGGNIWVIPLEDPNFKAEKIEIYYDQLVLYAPIFQ